MLKARKPIPKLQLHRNQREQELQARTIISVSFNAGIRVKKSHEKILLSNDKQDIIQTKKITIEYV